MTGWLGDWVDARKKRSLMPSREARSARNLKTLASELPQAILDDIGLTRSGMLLTHGNAPGDEITHPPGRASYDAIYYEYGRRTDSPSRMTPGETRQGRGLTALSGTG